ncbi:MAG TPA: anti-sigma factor [Pyrinomonadaceae bacterium]
MQKHEEYKEMLAAQALGALDGAEARALEAHLEGCDECRAELQEWRQTASVLAYCPPAVEPSKGVRARILADVRNTRTAGQESAPVEAPGKAMKGGQVESVAPVTAAAPVTNATNVREFAKPARRGWGRSATYGALAASLAFVALISMLFLLWQRNNAMRAELARLSDRLDQAQRELAGEREALAHQREVVAMVSAPEARIAMLAGTEMAARARARFLYDRSTGRAMLLADNLPPAPAGKAYQLWFIAEGKPPMPGHLFEPDATGHAEMREQLPAEARGAAVFAVTLEPSAGVSAPTGDKYLLGASS